MSSRVAVDVVQLSKEYRVYSHPHFRIYESLSKSLRRKLESNGSIRIVKAVENVSFQLDRGESISILGENGSGKSTLLQMLAGVVHPTSGHVDIRGRTSAILELGAGFNPEFSGRSNATLSSKIYGVDAVEEDDEVIQRIEDFADIGEFFDAPVKTYSSGMYVRLAFATAIMSKPEILIIDEALAVGDMFFQQKCFDFIENELSGVAKILVTHDLASASRFADRCLVMRQGTVEYDGEVLKGIQIYTSHRTKSSSIGKNSDQPAAVDDQSVSHPDSSRLEIVESDPSEFSVISLRNNERGGENALGGHLGTVSKGKQIDLSVNFKLGSPAKDAVFGYFLRNRTGLFVFGYNTASLSGQLGYVGAGLHQMTVQFVWPDVEPGAYSLSVGFGDGKHPLFHRIVGWSQGIASYDCVAVESVHGVFNNPATFRLSKSGEDA